MTLTITIDSSIPTLVYEQIIPSMILFMMLLGCVIMIQLFLKSDDELGDIFAIVFALLGVAFTVVILKIWGFITVVVV